MLETFRWATGVDRPELDSERQRGSLQNGRRLRQASFVDDEQVNCRSRSQTRLIRRRQIDSGRFLFRRAAMIQAIPGRNDICSDPQTTQRFPPVYLDVTRFPLYSHRWFRSDENPSARSQGRTGNFCPGVQKFRVSGWPRDAQPP